ncbi:hypothetical protein VA7868_04367 [Vibrio aerogenes CECT 7868]|uniref:DnaJ homologue subfamily C member 28 conserved domain-containing protein n=1 Tax=Vibrio aerogenes CECT 7868 TaxID=1216006 RepID=A0A1M6DZP7_9VIBR|nr:DnaJ family domain-containing protein [Vibrio aerogenes]SHI78727.1 hypothetical protein VA7868_04367 [Vibrio aerogenes CECT 7868]
MQSLIDQLAEQSIQSSIQQGELENLRGQGKPLALEDLRMVPEHLRTGYHVLKNAGFLPPELEQRQEALKMCDLLFSLQKQDNKYLDEDNRSAKKKTLDKIKRLELKMQLAGMDTQFIHQYLARLGQQNKT